MNIFFVMSMFVFLELVLTNLMYGFSSIYVYFNLIYGIISIDICVSYIYLWFIYYMGIIVLNLIFLLSNRVYSYINLLFSLVVYVYIYLFVCLLITVNDFISFIIAFESIFFPISFISLFYSFSNSYIFALYLLVLVSSLSSVLCIVVLSVLILHFNIVYINLFVDYICFDNLYFGIILWCIMFIIFGINYPIWPLHSWLPEVHVEVTTELSVLLASVVLNIGFFGVFNYLFLSYVHISIWLMNLTVVLLVVGLFFVTFSLMCLCDYNNVIAYWSVIHTCIALVLVWYNDILFTGLLIFCNLGHIFSSACMFLILGYVYDTYGLSVFLILTSYFGANIWSTIFLYLFLFNTDAPFTLLFVVDILVMYGLLNISYLYGYILMFINLCMTFSSIYIYMCISYFTYLWNNNYYRVDLSVNDIYLFSNIGLIVLASFFIIILLF